VTCREQRGRWIELARAGSRPGPALESHLGVCAACSRVWEDQLALGTALAGVAAENAAVAVPRGVEARVLAELAPRPRRWLPATVAALAASLAAFFAAGPYVARGPAPGPSASAAGGPFLAIPFVAPLAPYERAEVQRMKLPVAALVADGFEVYAPDMAGAITADVLVGQDGRAHAIRLVAEVTR